tara:strand:- start:16 stop:360 length:345 start_codon:yes stop_codon:yes gene_type:complete
MAHFTGWISVDVDLSDYADEITVEFDDIEDVIDAASNSSIYAKDIVDHVIEREYVDVLDIVRSLSLSALLNVIDQKINEENESKDNRIRMLLERIDQLESKLASSNIPSVPSSI